MSELLRETLAQRAEAAEPPRFDVQALVTRGEKRLRRRRMGAVVGSVLAVALAVGVPAVVMDLRDEPRSVEQPKPPPPPKKGDKDIGADARPLVYAEGSILHVGNKKIDTGLTPATVSVQARAMTGRHIPDPKIMNAMEMTDDGAVFTTLDGRIWFSDGASVQHIGEGSTWQMRDGGVQTEDPGSRVAWLEPASEDQVELVVYDTSERAVLNRVPLPRPHRGTAFLYAMYGDHVYWTRHDLQGEDRLMRTVLSDSHHERATQRMLAAEPQTRARTLVVGGGRDAQVVSPGAFASADPDDPNFRLVGSRLEFGLFDPESQDIQMPLSDPVSGKRLRFRAPANLRIEEMVLFEWRDDDRFVLSTRPGLSSDQRRDFVTCRVSTERCEVTLPKQPGPWLVLPGVSVPG